MRRALALFAIAVAGFALGFAGCGEEDSGPGGGTDTAPVTTGTTTTGDDDYDY